MGFTKMTPEDQAFNISFVGEVKKYPCLFDSKQAQIQDKAWTALSALAEFAVLHDAVPEVGPGQHGQFVHPAAEALQ